MMVYLITKVTSEVLNKNKSLKSVHNWLILVGPSPKNTHTIGPRVRCRNLNIGTLLSETT